MKKLFEAKKAMFFTLIAILIIGLLVLTFSTKIDIKIKGHLPVLERRIIAVNTFVHDIENTYLERMLRISTLSAFNALRANQRFRAEHSNYIPLITSDNYSKTAYLNEIKPPLKEHKSSPNEYRI